jgi:hypothetical protein
MSDSSVKIENAQTTKKGLGRIKYPIAGILMMLCIGNVYSWSVFSKA